MDTNQTEGVNTNSDEPSPPPTKITAHVQNIGSTELNTHSGRLPVFYVIIGCGTAAVVNHTTLRQTDWGRKRIGSLPVMHIGFKDPWRHYFTHGMGQPPYLLGMPGYEKRPSQNADVFTLNPGCRSDRFAACTEHEWNRLRDKYGRDNGPTSKFHHVEGWVAVIQSQSEPFSSKVVNVIKDLKEKENLDLIDLDKKKEIDKAFPSKEAAYRLVVVVPETETSWKLEFVYAEKIDICTGAGRPRVPPGRNWTIAKSKLWVPARLWEMETKTRKVVNGPEALIKETVWKATDRIYVHGAGGIGLNMVERGEGENCYVDWLTAKTLHASFNLPRNDTVLRHGSRHLNVNTTAKEELEKFLKEKVKNVRDAGKIAAWLVKETKKEDKNDLSQRRQFKNRRDLKERLLSMSETLRRQEGLGGGEGGVEGYGVDYKLVAESPDALDVLDPRRNPALLGKRMSAGESGVRVGPLLAPSNTEALLTPCEPKWRFGGGSDLEIVKVADMVTVKIKGSVDRNDTSAPPGMPKIRDFYENDTFTTEQGAFILSDRYKETCQDVAKLSENEGGLYHRVCVTLGILNNDFGEPSSTAVDFSLVKLNDQSGKAVGLQTADGSLRVLGAAAQVHPSALFVLDPKQTDDPTSLYFNSLPLSAVPPGFIFSGLNVAVANHYFDQKNPNPNVNTMTAEELAERIRAIDSKFALPANLALKIVKYRRLANGYESIAALKKLLLEDQSYDSIENNRASYGDWEKIVEQLMVGYADPRPFWD